MTAENPKVGIVSLGCPKALVDSERILTKLRAEGYDVAPSYDNADVVLVNTCGFIDSAKAESLDAIGEAMKENGRVVVTGCMGVDENAIRDVHPDVLSVTGPHQYEQVLDAIHDAVPPVHDPYVDLLPPEGLKLTPRHYSYLKISEGCNHSCAFCIIPSLRGKLDSRPVDEVLAEASKLAFAGVKELLVISQDTSAYGLDRSYETRDFAGRDVTTSMVGLAEELGKLNLWTRLHYVYPYPHVDEIIPLMADGKILPYLDIPFQHAAPNVLKKMKRPGNQEKVLERIQNWRKQVPDLTLRSTFIVGFPGETEEDVDFLIDWMKEAQLDRVGCFKYEAVDGAPANDLPGAVPEEVKQERWERFMAAQAEISGERMAKKVGKTIEVIIDEVDEEGAVGRSWADAPEIDGEVYLNGDEAAKLKPGNIIKAKVEAAEDYDLWADYVELVEE